MAWQLIVEMEGNDFRIVRKRRVEMPVPGDAESPPGEGVYLELRNDREEPMFRQNLSSRLEEAAEVFSADRTIQRVDVPERKRTLLLIVPDDGVHSVAFMKRWEPAATSGRRVVEQSTEEPRELARFDLTEDDS